MKTPPPITIWIHGTKLQQLLPKPLATLHIDRLHKFMECPPGLVLAQEIDPSYHHYHIARTLHEASPATFAWETFYVFGWSGILNHRERHAAALNLHAYLHNILHHYEQQYLQKPHIRIITHSHGGNVALNLATIPDNSSYPLAIDELILLACPVQKTTAPLIKSPLFKMVYSLHSHADIVQIADPQGWHSVKKDLIGFLSTGSYQQLKAALRAIDQEPFFSERHFTPRSKLIQVHIKQNNRNLAHIQFMLRPFIHELPRLLETIQLLQSHQNIHDQDLRLDITQGIVKIVA